MTGVSICSAALGRTGGLVLANPLRAACSCDSTALTLGPLADPTELHKLANPRYHRACQVFMRTIGSRFGVIW